MTPMALESSIPARTVELIQAQDWPVGRHLPAQRLADLLRVSRSPINEALEVLHDKGVVQREPNRGYFVARRIEGPPRRALRALGLAEGDEGDDLYFRIADDRLRGRLPDAFTETLLRRAVPRGAGRRT
jgi:DNA-binding GntR family transcriptional regulator